MLHFVRRDCTNSLLLPGSIISTTEQLLGTLDWKVCAVLVAFFFFKHGLLISVWTGTSDQVVKCSVSDKLLPCLIQSPVEMCFMVTDIYRLENREHLTSVLCSYWVLLGMGVGYPENESKWILRALTSYSNITQVGTKSMSVHCSVCSYVTLFSWCIIFF